jgi:hypothetical protein
MRARETRSVETSKICITRMRCLVAFDGTEQFQMEWKVHQRGFNTAFESCHYRSIKRKANPSSALSSSMR